MKKFLALFLFLVLSFNTFGLGGKGDYIGSAGVGLVLSPTLFMLSPSLEYMYDKDISIGVLGQLAFGGGTLFTVTGVGRWVMGNPMAKFRPVVEAGLGLAFASTLFTASTGVHLLGGFGVEYSLNRTTTLGSVLRLNFAPPLKSLFVSWPLVVARFLL
jgi:hypothetical protein